MIGRGLAFCFSFVDLSFRDDDDDEKNDDDYPETLMLCCFDWGHCISPLSALDSKF